jgi:phosphohistidine swiveling domain-containing protein
MSNAKYQKVVEFYKKQISLSEWFANVSHDKSDKLRADDNGKTERLRAINSIIELPFDNPQQFMAHQVNTENAEFVEFIEQNGEKLCAIRLIPQDLSFPKLRMRGRTIREAFLWFQEQTIDPAKYQVNFHRHSEKTIWSSIFVVNRHGISGEIIRGDGKQLTQGFYDDAQPILFHFDFSDWRLSRSDDEALAELKKAVKYIHVTDSTKRRKLTEQSGAKFCRNYLSGYFEIYISVENGVEYGDYSQSLGELYKDFTITISDEKLKEVDEKILHGRGASADIARGVVKIVTSPDDEFPAGAILVARVTTPDSVNLMKKSAGIITDQGGILSHAAIIARELGKPCVVDTGDATTKLHDGQVVEIDGEKGVVKIL